jgi:hypothetical protein
MSLIDIRHKVCDAEFSSSSKGFEGIPARTLLRRPQLAKDNFALNSAASTWQDY